MKFPASIFIVEDEALIAMELQDRLTRLGYVICGTAARGEKALEEIPAHLPDLVLMDIHLAGRLDGIETSARLREISEAPVIFLTAYSDAELLQKATQVEPFGYLVKPFEERALHSTIQMALYKHRMERTLRRSEAHFHGLLESVPDAIVIVNPKGEITLVNQQTERLLGYDRAELLGQRVELLLPEALRTLHVEHRARFHQHPVQREMGKATDLTARRQDGSLVPVEISLSPIETSEGRLVIASMRDITERKNSERHLLRTQRLDAIGTLAGGIAHDLNNALSPIVMVIEVLRKSYPREGELLDTLSTSAGRAVDMVRQLLTFARGREGERTRLRIGRLLQEIAKIVRGTFPKNIVLNTAWDDDLFPVLGDSTQLHQVLVNLCVNARDAMPRGGLLTVEAENREVDLTYASVHSDGKPGTYVVLTVRDTGMGISTAVMDRMFEPFFTTKEPDKGTGLGLSTVLGIVRSHGGFITVQSTVGEGSRFVVHLPAAQESVDEEGAGTDLVSVRGHGKTVLVVDDEPAVRQASRMVLESLDFHVVTVCDGTEAVIMAAQHRESLRLVITDFHMPDMDGLAVVRTLKRMVPSVTFIVASGRLDQTAVNELAALDVTTLLDKPFTQSKLIEALTHVLKKSS